MKSVNFSSLIKAMVNREVDRPNSSTSGTLSGHAAGEPFEKSVYACLKERYPKNIFKQYEYLNDLYLKNPQHITAEDRGNLLNSPTAFFLLSRGEKATQEWSLDNLFEERQNDTADILFHKDDFYDIIDVKTRNSSKTTSQPPNIISSYKLARMCALMIDNKEYDNFDINYIEIDWEEVGEKLKCIGACHGNLFKANPETLYINWAAALQIQFHVRELDQSWNGTREEWARGYIKHFVNSAEQRCQRMRSEYIEPFMKYIC